MTNWFSSMRNHAHGRFDHCDYQPLNLGHSVVCPFADMAWNDEN